MTYSRTNTTTRAETFTIADAKYLASRISHGLTFLRIYCGQLTPEKVQDLAVEAAILLRFNLLESVKYGYEKDGNWIYGISYSVNQLGQIEGINDTPSIIDLPDNLDGAKWHSFLNRRTNPELSLSDLQEIEELLPIQRTSGTEPSSANGSWNVDDSYSRNGIGISRSQFKSYY